MKEKFNLDKPKSNKEYLKDLNLSMNQLAEETNNQYGLKLLDKSGAFNPEVFNGLNQQEKDFIDNRIRYWAKVDDPDARKTFTKVHNLENINDDELTKIMLDYWHNEKENSKSTMLEMLVTLTFRKALGKNYLIMRSALIDDYKHGVDNIIINTETNEIICAFDEVHDRKICERIVEKNKKIIKQAQNGGIQIDHAVKKVGDKLVETQYKNVPNFYITLDIDELNEALEKINCKDINNASNFEQNLYIKFASSIMQQAEMLLQQPDIPIIIQERLKKVSEFFKIKK